jgi:shikimate dehydrogenase
MHNAAFEALGVDAVYLAFDVPPAGLAAAIEGMRSLQIRQLAVSIPHKVEVMACLDRVDETARRIGAVNTVTREEGDPGHLVGTNTDWQGVVTALERESGAQLKGAQAVVLGAGGAARAATFGLLEQGARVTVLNRTEAKAADLARDLGATLGGGLADLADLSDWDLLVNTTSVGMREDVSPVPAEAIRKDSVVMDAVYDPADTRLMRDARSRGARTLGGKWWLVHQAAAQLEQWTGREAPIDVMAAAFDEPLV